MGIFDKFTFDKKPLTQHPIENFKDSFPDFARQFKSLEKATSTAQTLDKQQFETLWGFSPPRVLNQLLNQLNTLGHPKFQKWESATVDNSIAESEGNIVEEVLLKAQIEYPTEHHVEWFSGSISLDPIVNGPNHWSGQNFSYLFPVVEAEFLERENPQIYLYNHTNPDGWGTNLEVMTKDLSSFLYIIMATHAFNTKKINNNEFFTCYQKSKDKVKLPYYFFNSFRVNGQWISTYNFNYRPNRDPGSVITIDYFNRARWIIELLKGNHNNYLWSIRNSFYNRNLNPVLSPEIHEKNLEHLPLHVPDALYYLFRCFFRDEKDQLKEYISVCKNSSSRIIKDAAKLAEKFNDGMEFFGEIDNIQRMKQDFAQGMNW